MTVKRWNAYAAIGLQLPLNDVVIEGLNDTHTVQRAISAHAVSMGDDDTRRAACVLLSGFCVRSMYIRWVHCGVSWYVKHGDTCARTTAVHSVDTFIRHTRSVLFGRLYRYVGLDKPPTSTKMANDHLTNVHAKAYTSMFTDAERRVFDTQVVPMMNSHRARSTYDRLLTEGDNAMVRVQIDQGRRTVPIIPTDAIHFGSIQDMGQRIEDVVSTY